MFISFNPFTFQGLSRPPHAAASTTTDHLLIDLNPIIYDAARAKKSPSQIFGYVKHKVDSLIECMPPRKSVYLALDGPAPFAKMVTQRRRREAVYF